MLMALNEYQIRQIIQLRGLGYTQQEIADHLGVSRKTVENHLRRLRAEADDADNIENFFWEKMVSLNALAILAAILNNQQRQVKK